MSSKFLMQAKEMKSSKPTKALSNKKSLVRDLIRSESAFSDTSALFPKLDESHRMALAHTTKSIFNRAESKGASYTPFKSTPEGSFTHPQSMVNWFSARKAQMPPMEDNQSLRVTINSMSALSGVSKGSLASVNAGNQHMTVHALEAWRKALAAIGSHNDSIESVHEYSDFGEPNVFLCKLLEEWRDLVSTLPLTRIEEWAEVYSGLSDEQIKKEVEDYRPSHKEFLSSMVRVWRDEFKQGKMESYIDKTTLLDVLHTRTVSRRIGRGFHTMIEAVHTGMAPFNSRISYPKTNFAEYKRRYGVATVETGLTSEVLMGYCLFTGINPIAMLHWVACQETKSHGTWNAKVANTPRDMLEWLGAMSPVEYARFHTAIHQMGLVSDQNRWALGLFSACWVYCDLPTQPKVKERLGADYHGLATVADEFLFLYGVETDFKYDAVRYKTPVGMALAAEVNVFEAHNDLECFGHMSCGESNHIQKYAMLDNFDEERNAFDTAEEFVGFMRGHLCKEYGYRVNTEDGSYMQLVTNADGEVDIANSYRTHEVSSKTKSSTTAFYRAIEDSLAVRT